MEGILTHFNNPPGGDSGSDRRGKGGSRSDSPPIDPDEEIDEDGAFNSEDELAYGDFFPPISSSSANNARTSGGVVSTTRMMMNDAHHAASSSSRRSHRADGLPTSRSRSTSIAMIDEVVALRHPHHHQQQYQGGGGGGGGGGGRNRIFSIDFDREFSFLSLPPSPPVLV
jgi:hypothetical protein